jgi:hypothetical protein
MRRQQWSKPADLSGSMIVFQLAEVFITLKILEDSQVSFQTSCLPSRLNFMLTLIFPSLGWIINLNLGEIASLPTKTISN